MKKLKFAVTAFAAIIGLGGAVATAEVSANKFQTLDASSVFNSTTPNISLSQKNIRWTCAETAQTACYYTLNPSTHRYTVPSTTKGFFINL